MTKTVHILIVEDNVEDANLAKHEIRKVIPDCEFQIVATQETFLGALETFQPDVILSDYSLPHFDGMKALTLSLQYAPLTPFLIWAGSISEDAAVDCMKAGANNYILKDNLKRLGAAVIHALEEKELIVARRRAEEALQNNEKRFRALIENGLDDISLLAADGRLLWESPSTVRNLGYEPDEFVGRNIFELMHPDDLEWTRNTYAMLLQKPGDRQRGTFRLRRADGTWRWVEAIATNMLADASVNAIVVNYRDITEQKQAEIELQQRNDDLALINALNEVINRGEDLSAIVNLLRDEFKRIFSSEYTNIYLFNQDRQSITLQQYSIPPEVARKIEKIIGRTMPTIDISVQRDGLFQSVLRSGYGMVVSDRQALQKWIGEFAETSSLPPIAKSAIRRLIPQIYKILNIKSTILVPLISDGKTLGVLNVSSANIFTEQDLKRIEKLGGQLTIALRRKQVEDALQESQARYQTLVETSHDLIWSVDTEGKITFLNRAAKEIYGYEPEELIGRSFFELLDSNYYRPEDFQNFTKIVAGANELNGIETYVRHRDGRQIILSANSMVLRDEHGNVTGVTGSSHDITARKWMEEALKEERNLLRTLIDNIPDRIYAMDIQGRKTLSNTADWKASGGKTMEDVIGKTDFDMYPPDLAEEFWQLDKAVLESGQPVINYEEPGLDPDGNRVSILTTKIPLRDEARKVIGLVGIGRDITERKKAEARMNDLLAFNETILNHSSVGILTYKLTGECIYANEHAAAMVGAQVKQVKAKNFRTLESWKTSGLYDLVEKSSRTQAPVTADIHMNTSFGKDVWMTVHCVTFKLKGEDHVLISAIDITERKRAEAALQASEARFRTLVNHATDGFFLHSEQGNILDVNQQACESLGYTREELIGLTPLDFDADITVDFFEQLRARLAAGETVAFDTHHRRKDGTVFPVDVRIRSFWEGGQRFGVSFVRDITERKQAEERLRHSENRYRLATKATNDVIWESNLETGQLFWSANAHIVFGYAPEEIEPNETWWDDRLHPEDRQRVVSNLNNVIASTESLWSDEYRFLLKDGSYAYISDRGYIERDANGTPLRMIGAMTDITERKRAEIERQALLEIMQGLANTKDLQELLKLTHQSIAKVIYAENFFVVLHHENTGLFEEIYSVDQYDPPEPPSKLEHSITSYVFRSGEPLLLTQALFDELEAKGEVKLVGTNSASWLGVPLKTSGRTIGVMAVQDYENDNRYLEREKDFLTSIATQVALVIERKRAEESLHRSEALYRQAIEVAGAVPYYQSYSDEGKFINYEFIGEGIRQITGYGPEEFSAALWDSLVEEIKMVDDLAEYTLEEAIRQVRMGNNSIWKCEHRLRARDGKMHWILEAAVELRDENGISYGSIGTYQDITERKQAEQALRESEEHYRTIFEGVQDAIFVESLDGKILMVNERACEMFGYTHEEFLTKTVIDLVPAGHAILMSEGTEHSLSAEPRATLNQRANGEIFPIEISGRVQIINGQKVLLVVVRDITERKRSEAAEREQRALAEALRATAETLNSTLDYGEVLDQILTAVGNVVPHNAASILLIEQDFARVVRSQGYDKHGFQPEAIMGIRLPLAETTNLREILATRQPLVVYDTYSYPGWQRMPTTDWLRASVSAPISIYGEVIGFICLDAEAPNFFTPMHAERLEAFANQAAIAIQNARLLQQAQEEITERKKSESALLESNTRFRTLFEASPDAIVLIDPHQGWTIIDCNTAACQMNGYSREELLGQSIDILNLHPGGPDERKDYLERIRQNGVLRYETSHRRKDGTVFTVDVSTSLIKFNTQDLILGIDRDVSERKQAEEEIRRRAEETSALLKTSLALTNLDLEVTLQTIGNSANSLFLADGCRIFLMEGDGETLRCVLSLGENTLAFSNLRIKVGEGVTGAVAASGVAEIVNEMQNDPRAIQVPGTDEEKEAVMFAPLRERDRTIGILSVRRVGENRNFQPVDLGLLEAFASMAASAVSNARLFEETQRRLADLHASEERFRQMAENIHEVFWITDAKTDKEIYISPAAEMVWGRSAEYMMYEPNAFIDAVFPEDLPAVLHNIEKEKNGERVEMEYRVLWPDGSIHWVWDRAFPVFDDSGKVNRIAGIAANITERKQADQQLRKLSRAVEHSGSTIVITDTAGNIEYVNAKFTETTGYSYEEVIGQNPRILKSGFTSEEEYKQLWQTIASAREWHGELLNKKKNGELFWESVTISPILNNRGEITHFVGIKEDITERKQSELETRRHIAELEAVYENGLSVGRLLEPSEIGNRVIETFARYLPWHHVTIRLRKEGSDDLELVAFNLPNLKEEERTDAEQHFIARINKVGQGLSGWVIQTGIQLRTGNVYAHPQYIDTHAGIQSGLYMPLKIGERVLGVISVESEAPNAFTEADERLLATLANQTAVAFENARLYEVMQKELSERKRVEDALRLSETHYRALADSITDILFELDQDLRYTHWNKASEALTGIPAQEAIGKLMEDIFGTNEEQARIKTIYEDVLRSHRPRTFETILALGSEARSFEINAYPSTRGVSVVAKDVTDRKRAETIMQKRFELMEYSAKHSLKDLMQKTVDEVSELTGSTIGFFHFMEEDQIHLGMQTWSTNALQLFHVSPEDGVHLPLDQAGVWAEAVRQRRPLIQNDYESLAIKKGIPQGHVPILREIVIPIIRNECIMAVMGIGNKSHEYTPQDLEIAARLADYAWDITERKQMEIALEMERNQLVQRVDERTADLSRANSNLARALRVKDEFLANMSHELRTPLNAILGLSESLGEQIAGPLNEKQQKYISTISESGHHLLSLINDILDLAKIDAGHITLDINKVDIRSVCQASLRMIKQLAQKKTQEVSLEIDNGLGLMWADERRLKQMIVNLLGNAVKFTPENGKLGLEVHGDEEANQIAITVWDNGIGIKEGDLARLFQPFVQLDAGLAREATGTGLGLALVAQMARLHGGSVTAISEAGKGSRFTIILPWEPALAIDTASRMKITGKFRAIKVDDKNKPTILVVEDTQEVVMMLKDYLELNGYKVFTAQDGVDGLVQARHVKPDLILMDVQMPGMDGFETTRKLRGDPNFRYTPIIALTALAMPHDRERCLEAGMDEYISKPVNLKALVKIIQSCLFERESRPR